MIANTLKFINDEASSIHGNVRISSLFVSESGEWRLGGLDILSSMKDDEAILYNYGALVPDISRYTPPEITKQGWDVVKRDPLPAVDSYQYGLMIFEIFNGGAMTPEQAGQTKNIPPSMQQSYKRLLNANPKVRLSTAHFLEQGRRNGGFFDSPIINLCDGMESLGLKSESEREDLLSQLDDVSDDFPEDFFKVKVLPELLKSVEFGGGGPKVFSTVMKIASKLSDDEWDSRIVPVIIRLFASPDRAIRVCLLDNLPSMIDHLSQKIVTDKIFPQMVTGFTDVAPLVREQTVKAVLTIITKLSDRTINGELLKYLAKTSNDEQPGIRTNTTICLGKIARNLGISTRQKVLIAAFSRSLRDPFVHARNAALLALAATSDLFPEDDCANKILPALCPSLVDKERLIRDQSSKTLEVYLTRVKRHGASMPDTALPPPSAATTNGAVPRMGTPQNDTSWAGWAISSFTNKLATASGEIEPKANVVSTSSAENARSASVPPEKTRTQATAPVSALHRQVLQQTAPILTRTPTSQFFSDAQTEDDELDEAWGEIDGDKFFDAAPDLKSQEPIPKSTFDDGGEPDFAGWLNAQAQAKSKAPMPKGLVRANPSLVRGTSTGGLGSGAGVKKLSTVPAKPMVTATSKVIDTKPKDVDADDSWGDAWD